MSIRVKRGSRAQLLLAGTLNGIIVGQPYLITDENRLAIGTAVNAFQAMAKEGEGGGSDPWTWQKQVADVANSTVTLAAVTGLSFTAVANATYLIEVVGAFTSAAVTTGIALALDIPSGSVAGQVIHPISATALGGTEQIADNATTGATSGVRAAATNVPIMGKWTVAVGVTGGPIQLQFRSEVAASAVTMIAALTVMGRRVIA